MLQKPERGAPIPLSSDPGGKQRRKRPRRQPLAKRCGLLHLDARRRHVARDQPPLDPPQRKGEQGPAIAALTRGSEQRDRIAGAAAARQFHGLRYGIHGRAAADPARAARAIMKRALKPLTSAGASSSWRPQSRMRLP